ncbi:acyl-CoA reductase [Clostridium lundense]|uniref:acyl-CoA reductase n=1 Tax=Clostridium lundense TaxID=319475 RepID=UPI000484954B|nr:acyl-CoA reductase [Clostridium lundense]
MVKCYTLNGEFYGEGLSFNDFNHICEMLKRNEEELRYFPVEAILLIINEYSKIISKDKNILKEEGVPFLCFYLKKSNLDKIIELNLKNKSYLDRFIEVENKKFIKAQKRGLACHWMAANVGTLGIYSILQSIICRNSNLVRIPEDCIDLIIKLLKPLKDIEISYEENIYFGKDLLKNICIVNFPSSNLELNKCMSIEADCRVFWGGEEALNSIRSLPQRTNCKDIIFGPKYSFAVFDKDAIESIQLEKYLENLVIDIIAFNQKACSSPHVLFLEKSSISIEEVTQRLIKVFKKVTKRYEVNFLGERTVADIINKRGEYALSLDKMLHCSKGFEYTILIDNEFKLEEPIGGRTIFLKEVDDVFEVEKLITSRVQTVGIAFKNEDRAINFAEKVTKIGVDRVVKVGYMNLYDSPWDGSFVISDMVRWCSLNINGMI